MPHFKYAWTRTRILIDAKRNARRVARLLNWNVPGVEAALLNYMLLLYEPDALADFILEGLETETHEPDVD